MDHEARAFERLYEDLSPRERVAILVQRLQKGTYDQHGLLKGLQINHRAAFNGYLGLVRARETVVGARTLLLGSQSRQLELQFSFVRVLGGLGAFVDLLGPLILGVTEPVSREEFDELLVGAREQWLPLDLAAAFAVMERGQRPADDSVDAWLGLLDRVEREIRAEGRAKELIVRGRGASYEVQQGSLCEWLGLAVEPVPSAAGRYEVFDDPAELEQERERQRHVRLVFEMLARWTSGPAEDGGHPDTSSSSPLEARRDFTPLLESLAEEFSQLEGSLHAVELANAHVARILGLEDVRSHEEIEVAERTAARLSSLRNSLGDFVQSIPLAAGEGEEFDRLLNALEVERSIGEALGRMTDEPPRRRR